MRTYGPSIIERVYAALADNPDSTCNEIAERLGMVGKDANKRLSALAARQRINGIGKRPCRVNGRVMTVWRVAA